MNVSIPGVNAPPFALTVEKIEDVYNTMLEVQSELNAVYQESSLTLKKAFESVELFVPELNKEYLHLPPSPTSQESKSLRQEPSSSSQRPESSSDTPKEASSPEEPSSRSPKPSTSSSNWMLKHQGPGSGLIELMPDSGIYVSEAELIECNLLKIDMRKFGIVLLPVVFSKEALQKCTFSGRSRPNRPAFDDHVKNTFVDYVTKHAKESGWKVVSRQNLLQSCNSKILALSNKHHFKYSPV